MLQYQNHTCIIVSITSKYSSNIFMITLTSSKNSHSEFHITYLSIYGQWQETANIMQCLFSHKSIRECRKWFTCLAL